MSISKLKSNIIKYYLLVALIFIIVFSVLTIWIINKNTKRDSDVLGISSGGQGRVLGCSQCSLGACCQGPEKVCDASGSGCMDARVPPRYVPPPRSPAPPPPPGSPPSGQPEPDDCPCDRDGIGNCNYASCGGGGGGGGGGSSFICETRYSPLWLRVYSIENGKYVSWKNWENVEPRVDLNRNLADPKIQEIRWSGANKLSNLTFDTYNLLGNGTRRYVKNFIDSKLFLEVSNLNIPNLFWEGDPLGADRSFNTIKPFKDGNEVVWDSTLNKIANDMSFEFYAIDPRSNQRRNDGILDPQWYGPWHMWSDHFCARGKGNINDNGYLSGNPKCVRINERNCDESGENDDGSCDSRLRYCAVDDDGCRGFWSTSKPSCSVNSTCLDYGYFDNLDSLLRYSDAAYSADVKYSGNWSMTLGVLERVTNPNVCMQVKNVLKFTAPSGYRCSSFKLFTNDDYLSTSDDTGKVVQYVEGNQTIDLRVNNIVWEDPSNPRICNITYEPKAGNLMILEIEPNRGCTFNTNFICDIANSSVKINYTASNIVGGTPVRSIARINKDPFSDWYNATYDKFIINNQSDQLNTSVEVPIQLGAAYDYRIAVDTSDGNGGFKELCSSPTVSFSCQPLRADYCSTSRVINHNLGINFEINSFTKEDIGYIQYKVHNADNIDANGNSVPVCVISTGNEFQGACPAGHKELSFAFDVNPVSTSITHKFEYSQVFVKDAAWQNKDVQNIIIKTYFAKDRFSDFAEDNVACSVVVNKYQELVISPTCLAPDTQSNSDSNSCVSFLRPLIQHKGDPLTIRHKMSGIDSNTPIKFDWADSMPVNSDGCQALYRINIWELGINGEYLKDAVSMALANSEYLLDSGRLDFGKTYAWEVIAMGVQKNSCGYSRQRSDIYTFTTNSFPLYVKSGFAYGRANVSNIPISEGGNPVTGVDNPLCDGNANCIKRFSAKGDWWGGDMCYTGNTKYNDTQNPAGTNRKPDNPITYWFEYFDAENSWGAGCMQNEMQLHRLAIVRKGQLNNLADANLSTVDSTLEVKNKIDANQIDGIYVEFDVSSVIPERTTVFETSKAKINAYRYLDNVNRMRIIYEVEFKEGMNTGDYEIFGSMVGTALDPRGETIRSSVLMFDLPFDWNNQTIEQVNGTISPIKCKDDDDDDNEDVCTCPGACCDKFEGDIPDYEPDPDPDPEPQPEPIPEPRPQPRPEPRPPVQQCRDEEVCVDKPIRICHNEEGNCWCPDPTDLVDGACRQQCEADEYICIDDWETVCTIKTICV